MNHQSEESVKSKSVRINAGDGTSDVTDEDERAFLSVRRLSSKNHKKRFRTHFTICHGNETNSGWLKTEQNFLK